MYDRREPDDSMISRRPGGSPVLVSIVTSAVTTVALFFGLRAVVPSSAAPTAVAAPAAAASAAAPAPSAADPGEPIPSLIGMKSDQARALLEARGLVLLLGDERDDPKAPAGAIVEQTPTEGMRVGRGGQVRVVLSRGMTRVAVPQLAGTAVEQAIATLAQAGLKVANKVDTPSSLAKGLVVGTNPPAGAELPGGQPVDLLIAAGPSEVDVPKVTGMPVSRAKKALEDAGLAVGSTSYIYDENYGGNVVLRQTPKAGDKAAPGAKVSLVLNEPD